MWLKKNWFFWIWLKELNLFSIWQRNWFFLLNVTQRIEPLFFNVIQRVFFHNNDINILPFFIWLKNWTFFEKLWLTEWNPSFQFDLKNWTLVKILLKELNPFQHMTRRIEHFFNRTFSIWLKELNYINMTWRVEPFFIWPKEWTCLEKWVKYLNPFLNMSQRIEFFQMIQIIEPHFKIGSLNWIFVILRIEFFLEKQRIERIEPFLDITESIEPFNFLNMTQRFEPFFPNITQRFVFFLKKKNPKNWTRWIWLNELNSFWKCDSKNWTLFEKMTQRIELFLEEFLKDFTTFF